MKIIEVSSNCSEILRGTRQPLIIGVSINNGYFNEQNLERLLVWASWNGIRPKVMIPDEPMISTFMSLGYSEKMANKKARLKANALENKCHMIIGRHRLNNVFVVRWSEVGVKKVYKQALEKIENLYTTNTLFKNAVDQTTTTVLYVNGVSNPSHINIETGVGFLLKELAFLMHASYMFHEEKYCYMYHKPFPILKDLIDGKYGIDVSKDIGCMVVE